MLSGGKYMKNIYETVLSNDSLANKVIETIKNAGTIIKTSVLQKPIIEKTGESNFVTEVDFQVQQYLCEALLKVLPGSNIIAEESLINQYTLTKPTWILDPVDGTTNLIHDFRHSAISLALYNDGKPEYGFVYNPYSDEMFYGCSGKGAYLNGQKIKVTTTNRLSDCLVGFGTTPYDRSDVEKTFDIVKAVFMKSREIRRTGSAALDIAYVAAGRLDAFFELSLQPWDYAAGIVILREAGGMLTDWLGEDVGPTNKSSILASNYYVYEELHKIICKNR